MRRILLCAVMALSVASVGWTQDAKALPPTASLLVANATHKAKAEHKAVLVIFHASWCGWCKKLESFLKQPEIAKVMERHYVEVRLDVMEQPEKASLENPGGRELMDKLGGKSAGLPFYVVLDTSGKTKADSMRPTKAGKENTGYPGTDEEIAWFVKMLKVSSPTMSAGELRLIEQALIAAKPTRL